MLCAYYVYDNVHPFYLRISPSTKKNLKNNVILNIQSKEMLPPYKKSQQM